MSMKGRQNPLGDDEDWIEDEIQRELDALDVNDLENDEEQPVKDDIEDLEDDIPDTVSAYLLRVQSRTEGFVKELAECDQVLRIIPANNEEFYYNSKELNELAFILGEDPEELRDRVITELENEDFADAQNSRTTNQKQGEGEPYLEQQHTDSYEITEENGKVALIHDADILEQAARKQIRELEEKHRARNMVAQKEREIQLLTDARKEQEKEEVRQQMKETYEKEQREMVQTRRVQQERIDKELQRENKELEASLQQYEQEIQEFSKKVEDEKKVFDEERHLRETKREQQEKEAATLIQSVFRSYRTRKPYLKRLQKMREDLKEKKEQERQCEILANRRKEEQRKKKEIMEKKRKQEEERIRKEEQLKKEEEEIKEEERKRLEKEEQERLQKERLEKERMEKEQLKREEEERERIELERKEKEILAKIQAEKDKREQEKKLMEEKEKEKEKEVVRDKEIGSKIELSDQQVQIENNKNNCPLEAASKIKDGISADKRIETKQNFTNKDLTKDADQEPENKEPRNGSSQEELPSAVQEAPSYTDNSDEKNVSHSQEVAHKSLCEAKSTILKSGASVNEASVKVVPELTLLPPLPEILEAKRIKWMQDCVPFSKIQGQVKGADQKIVHRQKRRPTSAKKLQPLTTQLLLSASPLQTSLAQVTTVRLSDLPGCSLTSLDQCRDMIAMEIRNCNLVALEGLENLPNVKYIDVENNKIEYISCKDRKNLASLNLSHNNLTVVHGLEGCSVLRRLDTSHNKITKLGCVASFSNLQVLNMSHNQLMTSQGLRSLALLQQVHLSNNHLSHVDGLENCCLLQKLNLANNNLSQIPPLQNHVLLQEINLCNNSISQMDALVDCWLPSLQHLNLSENSLEEIPPSLHGLPFLSILDIRHNFISEVQKLSGLEIFKKLHHLYIEGNAVNEESSYKSYVLSLLPSLQYLDSEQIEKDSLIKDCITQFEASCESQTKAQSILNDKWKKDFELLKNQGDLVKLADLEQSHLEQMEKMMMEHRYMHEYGDTTIIEHTQVIESQVTPNEVAAGPVAANHVTTSHVPANHMFNPPALVDEPDGIEEEIAIKSAEMRNVKVERSDRRTGVITTKALVQQTQGKRHTDQAATLIQAHWRGYCIRRDIHIHTRQWLAAVTIQTCCRGHLAKKRVQNMRASIGKRTRVYDNARHMSAATTIQAWWRGNKARHFIRNARQQAVQGLEDDDDDFFDHEIDLSSFDYVESDWRPTDEPHLPQSHPVLPSQHHPSPPSKDRPPSRTVRHAWRNINSPQQYNKSTADILVVEDTNTPRETDTELNKDTPRNSLMGKPPLPPLSSLSGNTLKTSRSEKQDQISEEWGFRDGNTAALMMKRAQKMRGKKKINDPMQRLKMMKKLQDTSRQQPIQVSKKGIQRKEYFQVRAEEKEQTSRKQIEEKNQRTFEWLHSQVNNPSDTRLNSKGMKGRHASSEPNLPRMSPDVLQGRVQLVASPSLELQSVDSRSTVTASPHRHRSHSFSSPNGDKIPFSTIKTNSAPTNHTRQRLEAKAKHKGYYKY